MMLELIFYKTLCCEGEFLCRYLINWGLARAGAYASWYDFDMRALP